MNKREFKRIKKFVLNCFLLIKRLKIKINKLRFRRILNKAPALIWISLNPNKGFKILPNNKSK